VPPHGLIDDDLCPQQDPAEVILHVERRRLVDFADEEIYGSSGQFTQDCRNEHLHLRILSSGRQHSEVERMNGSCYMLIHSAKLKACDK
jgi:hypothetical protein